MTNTELTESLQTATLEELHEDLAYTNNMIARKPLFPSQANAPRFLERKQDYRNFRDLILTELAARA